MEVVKTMIHEQDLPMHLWDEATRTTIYVQNIISHSALGFKTQRNVHKKETRGKSPQDIWLSSVCSYSKRKKSQVGSFRKRTEYLLDTMRSPRPSESIYQVTIIWKFAGM